MMKLMLWSMVYSPRPCLCDLQTDCRLDKPGNWCNGWLKKKDRVQNIVWKEMYPQAPPDPDHPCFLGNASTNPQYLAALQKTGLSQIEEENKASVKCEE